MYEVDFLPVENEEQDGGKSGDAIAMRFTVEAEQRSAVVVIDGGFSSIGDDLVDHIQRYYNTSTVDLMISTHPDADHLNGLAKVIERLTVRELMIHQPRLYRADMSNFSNLEQLDNLLALARAHGVTLAEPFAGVSRFGGQLAIMGPTKEYYIDLLQQQLVEAKSGKFSGSFQPPWLQRVVNLWESLTSLPVETLTDDGETSSRNNASVVTLVTASQKSMAPGGATHRWVKLGRRCRSPSPVVLGAVCGA